LIETEDIVRSVNDPTLVGIVQGVGWEDDSDDEEEDDEWDVPEVLGEEEIKVRWLGSNDDDIVHVNSIEVEDKSFLIGYAVASKNSRKQSGIVLDITILFTFQVRVWVVIFCAFLDIYVLFCSALMETFTKMFLILN